MNTVTDNECELAKGKTIQSKSSVGPMFTLVEIMFTFNVYTRRASKMWSVISTFFKKI